MTLGETVMPVQYHNTIGDYIGDDAEMEAGYALRNVLVRAKMENRLTCGVYQAARKLEVEPERVMLCIHADLGIVDVAHQLHFALLEAFCSENQIRLLKVGDTTPLEKICEGTVPLTPTSPDSPADFSDLSEPLPRSERAPDFSCVLVDFPEKMDTACTSLFTLYDHLAEDMTFPQITLAT
ncbi:growth arrest and DNA damage-inducible protein GADD45 alpha isoform X1 [Strongylocentrotus purpuratus]|uniref:Ribosomal protein L7Ae/L30e/S12e/Gadd45 domain-containing protein n=2 Tax=Strongylocentrotus purpuratus TaxID=7668 RepID=A0A7M7GLX0_STRPU|nr:growth arrest and DNA damage-inducible protein GADD45 alpha isoform X1 [Strongylocentrotus purpuratus]